MTKRVAILVTGSRDWTDREVIWRAINALTQDGQRLDHVVLIHGDAPGADTLAAEHARSLGMTVLPMPARWQGRARGNAGPKRNLSMVHVLEELALCGYEPHVLAFPLRSSNGTWDCVRKAQHAGFEVIIHNGSSQP